MNIALIGYGKMGKAIAHIAQQRHHTIGMIVHEDNQHEFIKKNFANIDVAIEFTQPESAFKNLNQCFEWGVPVVCGTTGWTQHLEAAEASCLKNNTAMLVSSNFSLGVNLFFAFNEYVAQKMNDFKDYDVLITEVHHTQKKDAPSGTAISLANQIITQRNDKTQWVNHTTSQKNELPIVSLRENDVSGIHKITYQNKIDKIEISHEAFNRDGFALGAVLAAEYISTKKGIFSMQQVLNLK